MRLTNPELLKLTRAQLNQAADFLIGAGRDPVAGLATMRVPMMGTFCRDCAARCWMGDGVASVESYARRRKTAPTRLSSRGGSTSTVCY